MGFRLSKRKEAGFSLVELMVTICLVAILAYMATYQVRQMLAKARQNEAKVGLAGLLTAEKGFRAEYNTYGNRLPKIGFFIESGTRLYTIGFPKGDCSHMEIGPDITSQAGASLNKAMASYYSPDPVITVSSRTYPPPSASDRCLGSDTPSGPVIGVTADAFIASATGVIAPGATGGSEVVELDVVHRNLYAGLEADYAEKPYGSPAGTGTGNGGSGSGGEAIVNDTSIAAAPPSRQVNEALPPPQDTWVFAKFADGEEILLNILDGTRPKVARAGGSGSDSTGSGPGGSINAGSGVGGGGGGGGDSGRDSPIETLDFNKFCSKLDVIAPAYVTKCDRK